MKRNNLSVYQEEILSIQNTQIFLSKKIYYALRIKKYLRQETLVGIIMLL